MKDKLKDNQPQITTPPKKVELHKFFGPYFGEFILPDDVLEALIKMTDFLLKDSESINWGENLAGAIKEENFIFKEDMINFGVSRILENCVRSYVVNATKLHSLHDESLKYETMINSAWVVSQFENEYNPVHSHTSCDISAVIYLKTPNVKGRRNPHLNKKDNDGDISFIYSAASTRDNDILDRGLLNFAPSPGMLYIFPSYLLHTVYPFIGKEERRSLAFNASYRITKGNEIIYGDKGNSPKYKFLESRDDK